MDGYRAIGVGEEVSVEYFQNERNKLEARRITGPDGLSPCLGTGIKKPKKLERCYNCFEKVSFYTSCIRPLFSVRISHRFIYVGSSYTRMFE